MIFAPFLLAIASAAVPAPSSSSALTSSTSDTARVIVVVGHNGGAPDPRPALSFADDDAARLYLQLAPQASRAFLLTTFDRESARLHPDLTAIARPPTTTALAQALGEAFWAVREQQRRGKHTELVFAFAGHGDVDDSGRGFVVLADAPFFRDDLWQQVVEASPADINHVIVDACASYFFVKSRGGDGTDGVALTPKLLDVLSGDKQRADLKARTGVFVSTSSAAEVHESAALSAGVFSYLLRSALLGASDDNGDGDIEYGEAAAFLAAASANLDDPRARLQVYAEPPLQRPHAPLTRLSTSGSKHFLAIDSTQPTHVRLKDSRGLPVAELHSDGRRTRYLALPAQPFFIVERDGRTKNADSEEAVFVPRSAGATSLQALQWKPSSSSMTRGAGDAFSSLFKTPYAPAFVAGYLATTSLPVPRDDVALFTPAWAIDGAPPARIPVFAIGVGASIGAGVAVGGAVTSLVLNQMAFSQLEQGFVRTGQLDPALTLEVERYRNATTAFTLGAFALGVVGGGLLAASFVLDDGTLVLP